jgi:hypothetical protein
MLLDMRRIGPACLAWSSTFEEPIHGDLGFVLWLGDEDAEVARRAFDARQPRPEELVEASQPADGAV